MNPTRCLFKRQHLALALGGRVSALSGDSSELGGLLACFGKADVIGRA